LPTKASLLPLLQICCAYQKCQQILADDIFKAPKSDAVVDKTIAADAILLETGAQNSKAYMLLSLCIIASDSLTFEAIQNAVTDDLPTADAKFTWQNICAIYLNLLPELNYMI
jgi:hypothetical protein